MAEQPKLFPNKIPNPEEHVQKHSDKESTLSPLNTKINNIATRLKILEERNETLRKKIQLTEQNSIDAEKEHFEEMQLVSQNILSVKKTLAELSEKVGLLADEINNFVKTDEFKVLEKYVSFWEPMDFVTRKEVNDFLRKKFGIKKKKEEKEETHAEEKTKSEIERIMKAKQEANERKK